MSYTSALLPYDAVRTSFNVRIEMVMSEPVDGAVLEQAVAVAMKRYPYFCKHMVLEDGAYRFADNDLPVVVSRFTGEAGMLNTPAVNGHLVSVDYHDDVIAVNICHMPFRQAI